MARIGLIEPGLAEGCRCALPLQAWAGAYRGGRPPTACCGLLRRMVEIENLKAAFRFLLGLFGLFIS